MIITTTVPFTLEQIERLKEQFDIYIKTVIDIKDKICVAGMDRHFEGEQILLKNGSKQSNLWGGGIEIETGTIDFNSFINIRPHDNNPSNEILDANIRNRYEQLTRLFFKGIL
ncbi:hypothetical protein COW38_02560 [Candidatus Collierbacteria bacterium CG17_big_fil_post_rev_8_21_14_2_50_45_7]|uniref:Uncharacterized protein n=1 Tax=Candidatus Collierbacteria bacterium CG17_big_fil_post_rev_8_21_14_2_50_45_7 TaxID=1974536 RepID=A0A2M7FPI8_9BACT|nr:MAG: hypothetical protein COW38_02560 [Candidatus Collierbacteria bacterium CG17_big_fil_post_rev_8_21_14_2_50_45_7]